MEEMNLMIWNIKTDNIYIHLCDEPKLFDPFWLVSVCTDIICWTLDSRSLSIKFRNVLRVLEFMKYNKEKYVYFTVLVYIDCPVRVPVGVNVLCSTSPQYLFLSCFYRLKKYSETARLVFWPFKSLHGFSKW